jgi:hypothetical protein
MALEQRAPRGKLTISPVNPSEPVQDVCGDLRDGSGPNVTGFYHNYLHGQTVLLRYLLPHFEIGAIKTSYASLLVLVLLATVGLCMMRLLDDSRREESIVFLVVTLMFARFFGLEWFGASLGHGPSDLILTGFLAYLAARAGAMKDGEWVVSAATFGALTIMFELLTGGLPLGGAMVVGLGWFALEKEQRSPASVLLGLVVYGIGAAIPMLIKIGLIASVFGGEALVNVASQGLSRMGSEFPDGFSGLTATSQLLLHLGSLTSGMWLLSAVMLCLALGLGSIGALRRRCPEQLLLVTSIGCIFLWFALFRQHTALHASFMVRILVWPVAAGSVLFALGAMRATTAKSDRHSHTECKAI